MNTKNLTKKQIGTIRRIINNGGRIWEKTTNPKEIKHLNGLVTRHILVDASVASFTNDHGDRVEVIRYMVSDQFRDWYYSVPVNRRRPL